MKFGIVVFPGSSGDVDLYHTIKDALDGVVEFIHHEDDNLSKFDAYLLPGGFSYGDYLRCGAIAATTPVIDSLKREIDRGKLVLGIGNGFQILTEAGILPGALMAHHHEKFQSGNRIFKVENNQTFLTKGLEVGEMILLPIAHKYGNYYADDATLAKLKESNRIVFTYQSSQLNSSLDIAGIINEAGNVIGMMPHPERAADRLLGNMEGLRLFKSILKTWRENA
jgi:phosphoribosylformylglycinamidine synthase